MIKICPNCNAKYNIVDEKIPPKGAKMKCVKCGNIFTVQKENVATSNIQQNTPTIDKPSPVLDKKHEDAKRFARVLASDILMYNESKVNEGLKNGNLPELLADEISKSWEMYKNRVDKEIVETTNYFKEALNNIIAKGQKIF